MHCLEKINTAIFYIQIKNYQDLIKRTIFQPKKLKNQNLLKQLVKDGNSQIIEKDVLGNYHFNGNFNNANSLKTALSNLSEDLSML